MFWMMESREIINGMINRRSVMILVQKCRIEIKWCISLEMKRNYQKLKFRDLSKILRC